jgi:hypothetical protein
MMVGLSTQAAAAATVANKAADLVSKALSEDKNK